MITQLLLATSTLVGAGQQPQALADLSARLEAYLAVRQVAVQTVPALTVTNDRAATIAAADALAAAIARARARALPGDIITPPVAAAIRSAIAAGCAGRFDALRRTIAEDLEVPLPPPAVNDRWPIGAPLPTMPPDVLEALPPLPPTLEYRFMDGALVLLDIDANLIVDFVRDAIPPPGDTAPARLVGGAVPPLPVSMLAGGQVFLELTVDVNGRVAAVRTLRVTPPLTSLVADTVRGWRFTPAQETLENGSDIVRFSFTTPRVAKVFVGAVFRPPSISGPTLGTGPIDRDSPDSETPMPVSVVTPRFPVGAFAAGIVLVELRVEADGTVTEACVIGSAPPFDEVALDAARQFRFRPALVEGAPAASYAYLLFGFPLPITTGASR